MANGQDSEERAPTALELFRGDLRQMYPPRPGSREERAIKLIDLPEVMQERAMKVFGLPSDIIRAFVIFLGGQAYPMKDALLDLAAKRRLRRLHAEPLGTTPCVELGCFSAETTGWKALGQTFEVYGDALKTLRQQYPRMDDDNLKKRIYKATKPIPAEPWQRSHQARATGVFLDDEGKEIEYSFVGDCCPHNATSTVSAGGAMARMAQTRAVNIVLRAGAKLPGTSAEEMPGVILDSEGRVVGVVRDREEPDPPEPTEQLGVEFSDAGKEEIERHAKTLTMNRGTLDQLIGQKRTEAAVLEELRGRVAKLSDRPEPPGLRTEAPRPAAPRAEAPRAETRPEPKAPADGKPNPAPKKAEQQQWKI